MAVQDGPPGSWVQLDNLIKIALVDCSESEEISMLEHLPNLKYLYFNNLKKVRSKNFTFKNLKSLKIYRLERLQCLPESLFYYSYDLSKLEIRQCPMLSELPGGLDTLNFLEELTISDCPNLKWIKNPSRGAKKYQGILRELRIEGCEKLMELPCQILESSAPTIKTLILEGLRSLKYLPMLIDCLSKSSTRLEELRIKGVPNFMASGFIENWSLSRLKEFEIDVSVEWSRETSVGIRETMEGMLQGCANSLTSLYLKGVENWEWLPQSIQHLTALSELKLENIGVQELPQWLGNLSSMRRLSLVGCKKLRCLPSLDALKRLSKYELLNIEDCPELCFDSDWRNRPFVIIVVDGSLI